MRKTVLGILLVAASVSFAQDSPLVAAAKKTNRKNPKTTVITNDTVGKGSGRVSYASGAPKPLPVVPATTSTAPATPAQKADNTPRPTNQPPATDPVSGYQTTVRNIEPQSTIRTTTPQATTARAPQTVPTTMPNSAGRNIDPSSSARNVQPTVVQPAQPPK
jgi:hypothetical protein